MNKIPYQQLYDATLQALHKLGGSASIHEIHDEAVSILRLSDEEIAMPLNSSPNSPPDIKYRLGWVRTWLKHYGLLENSSRGVWSLTPEGQATTRVDRKEVDRVVSELLKQQKAQEQGTQSPDTDEDEAAPASEDWQDELATALANMSPDGFERLCQRLLRESGFTQVEVTGKSGDGGIDGIGVVRISGFLSFKVLFQCKRWQNAVGAAVVRDFRGAMTGRTEKGLIITTGSFTPAAMREATRDGAPEIDLVDGEQLINKLKALELGVKTEEVIVEKVTIDPDFFHNI